MKASWRKSIDHVGISEGGYVNDPVDPGGETNWGISDRRDGRMDGKADLDADGIGDVRMRDLTKEQADKIYKRDYWDAVSGDKLPAGLDLVAFDAAVNSGVARGAKWVQRALGVKQDGRIGPATLAAAKEADVDQAIRDACMYRLLFLQGLKTWWKYKNGWTARVKSVEKTALEMSKSKPSSTGTDWTWLLDLIARLFKR